MLFFRLHPASGFDSFLPHIHDGESSSIGRAPDCGSGCCGIVPRLLPQFQTASGRRRRSFFLWGGAAEPPFLPVGRRLPLEKTDRPRALAYEAAAHAEGGNASADTTAWQMRPLGLLRPLGQMGLLGPLGVGQMRPLGLLGPLRLLGVLRWQGCGTGAPGAGGAD